MRRPRGGASDRPAPRTFPLNLIHVIKISDLNRIGFTIQLGGSSLCWDHERTNHQPQFFFPCLKTKYECLHNSCHRFFFFLSLKQMCGGDRRSVMCLAGRGRVTRRPQRGPPRASEGLSVKAWPRLNVTSWPLRHTRRCQTALVHLKLAEAAA